MEKHFLRRALEMLLPFVFVFIASIHTPFDPDLGWHLRYGEHFFTYKEVLRENIYSSEMPNYLWSNISWGTDVLSYFFYSLNGFFGLSLAAAGIITLTFFFFSKAYTLDYWQKAILFPLLLYFVNPINSISFRGQLISLMMLSVLVYLLKEYERGRMKLLYFVPVVFLFWANLHGLFFLGLGVLVLWQFFFLVSSYLKTKTFSSLVPHLKQFVPVSVVTLLATLVHPFGYGIYLEALRHFNNPLLKYVSEYNAVVELSTQWYSLIIISVLVGIGITAEVLAKPRYKSITDIGLFSVFFLLSLWVRRYSWTMYYLAIPLLQPVATFIRPPTKRGIFIGGTILFSLSIIFIFFVKQPFSQYVTISWDSYCEKLVKCSPEAARALQEHYKAGKTLTPYAWGGYLIWNFPGVKPSADGRMHLWRDETGYSGFEYGYMYEWDKKDVNDSKYDVVLASKSRPVFQRLRSHALSGRWKLVYQDDSAAVFVRLMR